MRDRAQQPRRGYSLIEVLLVISALAIVMGICVSMIFALMRIDRAARAQVIEARTVEELARQFRRDARAAVKADLKHENAGGITLKLADNRVVAYRRQASALERIERGPNPPERRELYRLPARERAEITVEHDQGSDWAVLVLPPRVEPDRLTPARPVRVVARIGSDRLQAGKEER